MRRLLGAPSAATSRAPRRMPLTASLDLPASKVIVVLILVFDGGGG